MKSSKMHKDKKSLVVEKGQTTDIIPAKEVVSPIPVSTPEPNLVSNIPKEFLQLLNKRLVEQLTKEVSQPKVNQEQETQIADFKLLEGIVCEFLKTFVIIGYNLKGEKVVIGHASSPQDNDALTEHLRQTFLRVMNSIE